MTGRPSLWAAHGEGETAVNVESLGMVIFMNSLVCTMAVILLLR